MTLDPNEKKLKELMTQKTSESFDKNFWNEFEKIEKKSSSKLWSLKVLVPTMVVVLAIFVFNNQRQDESEMMQVAFNQELIENYEMLDELDEELIELDAENWEVLLAQT